MEKRMINSYVALDLETSGLNPKLDKILEIGAVRVRDGVVTATYETFVNPGIEVPKRITELTGITQEMAETGKDPEEALKELLEFCGDDILLGHNIQFDYGFIKKLAVNCRETFEKEGIDTLRIARAFLPELESRRLEYLTGYFQIEHKDKHRAYCDAMAAGELYQKLAELYYDKNPKAFECQKLLCEVKREGPVTPAQRSYLTALTEYHGIALKKEISKLTKNEASRLIDQIILENGRLGSKG